MVGVPREKEESVASRGRISHCKPYGSGVRTSCKVETFSNVETFGSTSPLSTPVSFLSPQPANGNISSCNFRVVALLKMKPKTPIRSGGRVPEGLPAKRQRRPTALENLTNQRCQTMALASIPILYGSLCHTGQRSYSGLCLANKAARERQTTDFNVTERINLTLNAAPTLTSP